MGRVKRRYDKKERIIVNNKEEGGKEESVSWRI